jgi:hypothetical protein
LVAYMKAIHFEPPRTETSHTGRIAATFCRPVRLGGDGALSGTRLLQLAVPRDCSAPRSSAKTMARPVQSIFGPSYGLPPAISGHQNYFLWGRVIARRRHTRNR